jgi:glycosyltransferase involved in cell wall biosynthesis
MLLGGKTPNLLEPMGTSPMTSVAFIVNGNRDSAMGHRARAFASRLRDRFVIDIAYRANNKAASILRFFTFLRRLKPSVTHVFDMSYSGVCAAWLYKLYARNRLIIDTGDAIYELARSTGSRGPVGLLLTRCLEEFSLRVADKIVVRGRVHQKLLRDRGYDVTLVPDGVDTRKFVPLQADDLRKQHKLNGELTVGLVGSSIWSEKLRMCYGWELIEMLRLLKDEPLKGIIIGDGSGIAKLKARCREYGIADKVLFLGRVPYEELPRYLNLIDVCLSTQTNDLVGQVRTTGKLPLYLAAGRYVLASEVGEAARVLDKEMLLPYEGVKDEQYPRRLAAKIKTILSNREILSRAAGNVTLAKDHFDYAVLARRVGDLIDTSCTIQNSQCGGGVTALDSFQAYSSDS